jgi:urease accessory protein
MTMSIPLPLIVWLSPSFPVGAFAFSHGLEWAMEAGDITNAHTAIDWLSELMSYGSGRSDCVAVALAWKAANTQDHLALSTLAELTHALQPSSERRLEAGMQGRAFLQAIASSWSTPQFDALKSSIEPFVTYPIAVGLTAASYLIPLEQTVKSFALGFISNLVSALIRLGPLGQTDGQRVIAALLPKVEELAEEILVSELDDLGSSAFRSDIASMRHETQYTRLFRS